MRLRRPLRRMDAGRLLAVAQAAGFDAAIDAFVPGTSVQAERSAGAARGAISSPRAPKAGTPVRPRQDAGGAGSPRARPGPDSGRSACCRPTAGRDAVAPSSTCRTT
jgi:hypothetical protein